MTNKADNVIGKKRKRIKVDEFSGDATLVDIVVAEGVERIRVEAFAHCPNLKSVVLPNSLTSAERYTFSDCSALEKVVIGTGLTKIADGMFKNCVSLRTIVIPANVTTIGENAFEGCAALESLVIEGNCKVREMAFAGCVALKEIKINGTVTGVLPTAFKGCVALCAIDFPEGLEGVGTSAFEGCTSLKSVTLPKTTSIVASRCFAGCTALSEFHAGIMEYGAGCFDGCVSLPTLIVDGTLIHLAERGKTAVVPAGVVSLECSVFDGDGEVESVILPDSLKVIKACAFYCCSNLKSIELPKGVTTIESRAFWNCESLSSVRLPNGLREIGSAAFGKCPSLATVSVGGEEPAEGVCSLPSTLASCDDLAFAECAFKRIKFPDGIEKLGRWVFSNCENLTEVVLPKTLQNLDCWTFSDCKALKHVEISYGALKSLARVSADMIVLTDKDGFLLCSDVFNGCPLEDVAIPDYLEAHLNRIFKNALPDDVKLVSATGEVKTWNRETPEDLIFFAKYGFRTSEIDYWYESACDFYVGCRVQKPLRESRSVVIPARYKDSDPRELVAKIYARGASKTYSISVGEEELESYSLQRDAKKSKFWPVFAALAAYKPRRW